MNGSHIFERLIERKRAGRRHRYGPEVIAEQVQVYNLNAIGEHHLVEAIPRVYSLSKRSVDTDVLQFTIAIKISHRT